MFIFVEFVSMAEDLLEIIRRGIQGYNKTNESVVQVASMSIADEINKLSKLKDQAIITASEFDEMKRQLISKCCRGNQPRQCVATNNQIEIRHKGKRNYHISMG